MFSHSGKEFRTVSKVFKRIFPLNNPSNLGELQLMIQVGFISSIRKQEPIVPTDFQKYRRNSKSNLSLMKSFDTLISQFDENISWFHPSSHST